MEMYEKKDTQEDANVLDCLSEMAISGPVDFYTLPRSGREQSTEEASLK